MSKDKLKMYEYDEQHQQYRRRGGEVSKSEQTPAASDIYKSAAGVVTKGANYKGKRQKVPVSARAAKIFFWFVLVSLFTAWVIFMYKGFIEEQESEDGKEMIIPELSRE